MGRPVVVFPDAVEVARTFLLDELAANDDTAPVVQDVPDTRPERFVTIHRGGGIRQSLVSDNALLLVECWAATSAAAHDLAQLCRALLLSMAGEVVVGVQVYRVDEVGGPAELPDPLSGQPRYVFTVQAAFRGSPPAGS